MPEVIDAWFDSGSMPFAQWGYPHVEGSAEMFERAYPADFICEAIDQTRGWFYTLMAVGTLVFDESSYQNVLCLGHILAEDGRKMSKHLGNILEPIPLMDEHGADAVRWFMAAGGSPWAARRVGHATIQEIVRKVLLTYWNTVAFHVLYADAVRLDARRGRRLRRCAEPAGAGPLGCSREAHRLVGEVTDALEDFDTQRAGHAARRRSSTTCPTGTSAARAAASGTATRPRCATLHECLARRHPADGAAGAVHHRAGLAGPVRRRSTPDAARVGAPGRLAAAGRRRLVDADLAEQVALVRRLVELGRAARAEAKVQTRQPLRRALVADRGLRPPLRGAARARSPRS